MWHKCGSNMPQLFGAKIWSRSAGFELAASHSALGNATPEEYAAQAELQNERPDPGLEADKIALAYPKSC